MAKPKSAGKVVGTRIAAPAPPPPPPLQAEEPEAEFTEALYYLRSLGIQETDDFNIKVYQLTVGAGRAGGAQNFLFAINPEELQTIEERLVEMFPGGGRFRIVARLNGKVARASLLDIAPRPGWKPPPPAWSQQQQPSAHEQSAGGENATLLILRQMQDENRRFMEALVNKLSAPPPAPPQTLDNMLDTLGKVQSLIPKQQSESSLDMFQKGMDFAKTIYEGAGDKPTGLYDLARAALESSAVKDGLGALAKLAAQPQQGQQAQQLPGPHQVAPPAMPPMPAQLIHRGNEFAVNAIETLIGQAMVNADPAEAAEKFSGMMPDEVFHELEMQPDPLAYIEAQFPQVTPHRAWFARLIDNLWEAEQAGGGAGSPMFNAGAVESAKPDVSNPAGDRGDT